MAAATASGYVARIGGYQADGDGSGSTWPLYLPGGTETNNIPMVLTVDAGGALQRDASSVLANFNVNGWGTTYSNAAGQKITMTALGMGGVPTSLTGNSGVGTSTNKLTTLGWNNRNGLGIRGSGNLEADAGEGILWSLDLTELSPDYSIIIRGQTFHQIWGAETAGMVNVASGDVAVYTGVEGTNWNQWTNTRGLDLRFVGGKDYGHVATQLILDGQGRIPGLVLELVETPARTIKLGGYAANGAGDGATDRVLRFAGTERTGGPLALDLEVGSDGELLLDGSNTMTCATIQWGEAFTNAAGHKIKMTAVGNLGISTNLTGNSGAGTAADMHSKFWPNMKGLGVYGAGSTDANVGEGILWSLDLTELSSDYQVTISGQTFNEIWDAETAGLVNVASGDVAVYTGVEGTNWNQWASTTDLGLTFVGGSNYGHVATQMILSGDGRIAGLTLELSEVEATAVPYDQWAIDNGLSGADADLDADIENGGAGDGLNNLLEYALGGDPNVDDAAAVAPQESVAGSMFQHVYKERTDDDSLTFTVELDQDNDLTTVDWANTGLSETRGTDDGEFQMVTNTVPTTDAQEFIRLSIEKN
jgi:hypothetical protein